MVRIVVLSRRTVRHPLSGGAARYIHEIFRRLATRHSVTVLSGNWNNQHNVEEIDGITYRSFPESFHRILLPMRYVAKFAGKTDLLVDNCDVGIPWLSPMYSRTPRIAIIHQLVREIFYDELPRPVSNLGFSLEPLMYRIYAGSRIVAASQSTARDLLSCGIEARNIDVIEPGCTNLGFPRSALTERSPMTVACVSRLMKYKGIQLAFGALRRIIDVSPNVRLVVGGSGPYHGQLLRLSNDLGLSKNVSFLGRVSDQSKFKIYSENRVAISPSSREGFGISVIEANSVGTPVVGWDVPGSRDSILDGTTGFLAPFPDKTAFADRVSRLLTDDQAWNRLSESAWKWAREHSWDKSARAFEETITRVLQGS